MPDEEDLTQDEAALIQAEEEAEALREVVVSEIDAIPLGRSIIAATITIREFLRLPQDLTGRKAFRPFQHPSCRIIRRTEEALLIFRKVTGRRIRGFEDTEEGILVQPAIMLRHSTRRHCHSHHSIHPHRIAAYWNETRVWSAMQALDEAIMTSLVTRLRQTCLRQHGRLPTNRFREDHIIINDSTMRVKALT